MDKVHIDLTQSQRKLRSFSISTLIAPYGNYDPHLTLLENYVPHYLILDSSISFIYIFICIFAGLLVMMLCFDQTREAHFSIEVGEEF